MCVSLYVFMSVYVCQCVRACVYVYFLSGDYKGFSQSLIPEAALQLLLL